MDTMARVKQIAEERELSLFQLSQLCDISYNTLKRTEDRKGQLTVNTIEKICIGLRIPMSEFFSQ
jgi:transcriptional regulator with XRE-family HTH domain